MILNKHSKIIDLLRDNGGSITAAHWLIEGFNLDNATEPAWFTIKYKGENVISSNLNNDVAEQVLINLFNEEYKMDYTRGGQRPIIGIVDFIYNVHHLKLVKTNGEIYQSVISECERRFSNESYYPFTDYLYNKLISCGLSRDNFAYAPHRFEAFKHAKKLKYYYTRNTIHVRINGDTVNNVPAHIDLAQWGYKKITLPHRSDRTASFETWVPIGQVMVTIDGIEYPKPYADRYFPVCPSCGNRAPKLFMNKCHVCLGVDPALVQIRGYSDRAPNFLKFKEGKYSKTLFKSPLYLGVELELESDGRKGQEGLDKGLIFAAKTLGDHCIFKRDGSINNGFEIVSTAATLDVHKEAWKAFFAGVATETYLGKRDNVGMHVHVSREPLNFLTQGKMTEFMNRHDNKKYLKAVAGRWSEHYARQEDGRTVTFPFLMQDGSERYNALNLRNKATVEFRIFASTTNYDEFIMRLEFCEALASYCSPCQSKATNLKDVTKWEWFAKYVNSNYKQWPLLAKFIKEL